MTSARDYWRWLWASPASLLGLGVAVASLPFGTHLRQRAGIVECHGGPVTWLLAQLPHPALAMTLGHVVWGQSLWALEVTRAHERVHVGQYERWGPLFIPAYLAASGWLMLQGRDAYYENPFEREAFAADRRRASGDRETPP